MAEKLPEMPFLRNIGLIVTYKCQVSCRHCILKCGPHRTEEVDLMDAYNWIDQIASYNNGYVKVLSLTGGEPFYDLEKIKAIAKYADEKGLMVSAVTNAFWASTLERANDVLCKIPEVRAMAISSDLYHQEVIPFENVRNAVEACEKRDIVYNIHVCTEDKKDPAYMELMGKLLELTDEDNILTTITFPVGRAIEKVKNLSYEMTTEPPVPSCSAGSSPIIFPNGKIIACIGPIINLPNNHPLVLGNLEKESLKSILDRAEVNSILHAIRVWGPKRIISLMTEAGLGESLSRSYIKDSVCSACISLMESEEAIKFMVELNRDREFKEKVAYARAYYMKESFMLNQLGIY